MCSHQKHPPIPDPDDTNRTWEVGPVWCSRCSLADLAETYLRAKRAYYVLAEPIMSDTAFNFLEAEIERRDPKHPCLSQVGSAP